MEQKSEEILREKRMVKMHLDGWVVVSQPKKGCGGGGKIGETWFRSGRAM